MSKDDNNEISVLEALVRFCGAVPDVLDPEIRQQPNAHSFINFAVPSFLSKLESGSLIAIGRLGSMYAEPKDIDPKTWQGLELKPFEGSAEAADRTLFLDLRIRPSFVELLRVELEANPKLSKAAAEKLAKSLGVTRKAARDAYQALAPARPPD